LVPNKSDEDIFDKLHIDENSAEEKIILDQFHENIQILLNCLPKKEKEVIVLRHYYNLSFQEISERIEINNSTARSYLRKGMLRLRNINRQINLL
jgi:RNA polymerase sigma-70 factor (ECF subfamily)